MKLSYLADYPECAEQIAKWYFNEWGHTVRGITLSDVLEKVRSKGVNRNDFPLMMLIHENDTLVAVAELKIRESVNYPEYEHWIGGVFVAPEARGKGYACALIEQAKRQAHQLELDVLYLQCEAHNVALYTKLGFCPVVSTEHNGVETLIMAGIQAENPNEST